MCETAYTALHPQAKNLTHPCLFIIFMSLLGLKLGYDLDRSGHTKRGN